MAAITIDRLREDIWKSAHLIFTVTVRPKQFVFSHQPQTRRPSRSRPLRSERDRVDLPRRSSPTPKTFALGRIEPDDRLDRGRFQSTNGLLCRTALAGTQGFDVANPRLSQCQAHASWPQSSGPRHETWRSEAQPRRLRLHRA